MKRKTFSVNSWPNAHPTCSSSSSSGRLLDKFLITSFWQDDKKYYCLLSKALQPDLYLSPVFFFTEMSFMDIKPKKPCVCQHYSLMYFYWDKHPYLQSDTFTSFCNIHYIILLLLALVLVFPSSSKSRDEVCPVLWKWAHNKNRVYLKWTWKLNSTYIMMLHMPFFWSSSAKVVLVYKLFTKSIYR